VSQDSEQYVEKLLELFNRFSLLVSQAFIDDPRFLTSRDMVYLYIYFYCHISENIPLLFDDVFIVSAVSTSVY